MSMSVALRSAARPRFRRPCYVSPNQLFVGSRSFTKLPTKQQHVEASANSQPAAPVLLNEGADLPTASSEFQPLNPLFAPLRTPRAPEVSSIEVSVPPSTLDGRLQEIYGLDDALILRINGRFSRFDPHFLRDSCRCSQCVNSSGQKTFQTSDIPPTLRINSARVIGTDLELLWENDIVGFSDGARRHKTRLDYSFFKTRIDGDISAFQVPEALPWLKSENVYKQVKKISYNDFITNDAALRLGLAGLVAQGLIFIQDIPEDEKAVIDIAERIGPLRDTFYGKTWDVKDKPNADNVAYTSHYLGLHMDLLYMREPPGLQLLHCLRATCKGGDSMFADTFGAALQLRKSIPGAFQILTEFPVNFGYTSKDHKYRFTRPTIVPLQYQNYKPATFQLDHVNWSPPFQYPLDMEVGQHDSSNKIKKYLQATRAFASLLEDEKHQLRCRLAPGECVIFNNRRVVHGRTAFEVGTGERWLRGAYIDTDAFYSRCNTMLPSSNDQLSQTVD